MTFAEFDHMPEGLLERPASALYQQLEGPTLIHLRGRIERPLFVSVLQHGNEVTGWEAIRRLLKSHYRYDELPRSLLLYIGNVQAARYRLRHLDEQPDFNRCWPGGDESDKRWTRLFRDLHARILSYDPLACIDIHNNTGLNPHYAAINRVRSDFLRLAARFSPTVIYFTQPPGTLSHSMSPYLPAVTLECGQAGDVHGTDHSLAYIESCLLMEDLPGSPVDADKIHLYRMVAIVKVRDEVLFGFGKVPADLAFADDLDRFNFRELPAGTEFGRHGVELPSPLIARDNRGHEVTQRYFDFTDGRVRTRGEVMPAMLTLDRRVIQQDCLCYLMERVHYEDAIEVGDYDPLPDSLRSMQTARQAKLAL